MIGIPAMQYNLVDDEPEYGAGEDGGLALLHRAYMASIHQHRVLVGDLCSTLAKLGAAIDAAALGAEDRVNLLAGIGRHLDQARGIVASIDTALVHVSQGASPSHH